MKNNIKLLDGSMSFPLEKSGYNLKNRLWTGNALIEDPQLIKDIHIGYIKAGSDYISTSTYQVSCKVLKDLGYNYDEVINIFKNSVNLAKDAIKESKAKKNIRIVGSFGPYAAYLPNASEFVGLYKTTDKEIEEYHYENIEIIKKIELDIILFETIPCLRELKILLKLISNLKKEIWLSFTCNENIMFRDGSSIDEGVKLASNYSNIKAIGLNCFSPLLVAKGIEKLRYLSNKKILIYPNSGEIYDPIEKEWNGNNQYNGVMLKEWLRLSPDIIGGCCRVGYDNIKKMREEIDIYLNCK